MNQEIAVPELQWGETLQDRQIESAYLIEKSFPWIISDFHDLAGFPHREIGKISTIADSGLVPAHVPFDEVFATDGYSLILRGIRNDLEYSEILDFNEICEFPLRSRLDMAYQFPPFCVDAFSGFASIAEDPALGRHALPLALLWINAVFGSRGFKVFVVGKQYHEELLAGVARKESAVVLKSVLMRQTLQERRQETAQSPSPE